MSYELVFWKYKPDVVLAHQQVYEELTMESKYIEDLEELPIANLISRITQVFLEGWIRIDEVTSKNRKEEHFSCAQLGSPFVLTVMVFQVKT